MDIQVEFKDEKIEIDTGEKFLLLSIDEATELKNKLENSLVSARTHKELEKNWKFFGGL